jgi:hypothetical protein
VPVVVATVAVAVVVVVVVLLFLQCITFCVHIKFCSMK